MNESTILKLKIKPNLKVECILTVLSKEGLNIYLPKTCANLYKQAEIKQ